MENYSTFIIHHKTTRILPKNFNPLTSRPCRPTLKDSQIKATIIIFYLILLNDKQNNSFSDDLFHA